jgi:hypothetical protein
MERRKNFLYIWEMVTLDDGLEHKTYTSDDVKNNSSPMANKER